MQISPNSLIWLASASPRRSALLTQIGVPHRVRAVAADESPIEGEAPAQYVRRLALLKAQTLWSQLGSGDRRAVLGADTAVVIDERILSKPADEADCVRMLRILSGRTHQVFTAVALCDEGRVATALSVSDVTFRELSPGEMQAYWRSGEPADKAGAYAVQGLAAAFIERISGSYSGVMGLPLFETAQLLQSIGWCIAAQPAKSTLFAPGSLGGVRG
jgi:septum formation protein